MIFKEQDWVLLVLPDGGQRLFQLKLEDTKDLDIGRFGKFNGAQLVGEKAGGYYQVEADGSIHLIDPPELLDAAVEEVTNTNQEISDTNTSQRLSTKDIEALKAQVASGELKAAEVVQTVIQNSETFEKKNEFSKIKYIQRKQKKFLRWFALKEPTVRTLCAYFIRKDPRKIMDLRLDSVSQIICLSNASQAKSRILCWDETNGFLTGALMAKMKSDSLLVHVHPDRQMQVSSSAYFNFTENVRSRLVPLPFAEWNIPFVDEFKTDNNEMAEENEKSRFQKERFEQRKKRKQQLYELTSNARFDCLVIATMKRDPLELIATLCLALRASSKIIVYSTWRDLLLPAYLSLRQDNNFIDVSLTESWSRPYQAAPGRLHPHMNCNGHTGAILSATRIFKPSK